MLRKPLVLALAAIMLVGIVRATTAGRNGHEINHVQRERSAEQEQRALGQIQAAGEMIAQADNLINSLSCDPPHAAVVLIGQAKEHFANAQEAFGEGEYGEAYGLAKAAEMLARNAIRMLRKVENETKSEAENEEERSSLEENVKQSTEENLGQNIIEESEEQLIKEDEHPSIVWLSPDVIAQGESTTFYVDLRGDLSEVSVYLESPSGAWSAWRDAIGRTPDGLWYGEIMAPNQAEVGTWRITTLYIADRAGNWWYHDTNVAFEVTSAGNSELRVNRVWVSPTATAAGGSVSFFVDTTGDLSEVSVYIESPTRAQEGWRDASGKTPEGAWFGEFQVPKDAEEGTWKITIIYIRDKDGNWFYYRTRYGNPASFEVASMGNPQVGLERIWVSPAGVAPGETITFYIDLTGSPSEVSVYCENPSGSQGAWRDAHGATSDGAWYGDIRIPGDAEVGTWRITAVSIYVKDETGNWSGLLDCDVMFEVHS